MGMGVGNGRERVKGTGRVAGRTARRAAPPSAHTPRHHHPPTPILLQPLALTAAAAVGARGTLLLAHQERRSVVLDATTRAPRLEDHDAPLAAFRAAAAGLGLGERVVAGGGAGGEGGGAGQAGAAAPAAPDATLPAAPAPAAPCPPTTPGGGLGFPGDLWILAFSRDAAALASLPAA